LSHDQLPLVTFVVVAYQQEAFVREAIEGAFAQNYPRLQIVLSDDCSKDRTFEIMKEMAEDYSGPHPVVLNRNDPNLGITGHVNRVVALSEGELIVGAAGDDVSYPERTSALVDAWLASGRRAHLLHSAAHRMSADGQLIGLRQPVEATRSSPSPEILAAEGLGIIGATWALTPELFSRFGPLNPELGCEDLLMPFWAALLEGLVYVDKPLVKHREVGISSNFEPESGKELLYGSWLRYQRWWRDSYQGRLEAIQRHFGEPPANLLRLCREGIARSDWPLRLAATPYLKRWPLALSMFRDEHLPLGTAMKLALMYLLPGPYSAQYNFKRARWSKRRAEVQRPS
jgi:glycosyltransferase involved in cell wall biosynthesis